MSERTVFYLCPRCFEVREVIEEEHRHRMLRCDPAELDADRRKPPTDRRGHPLTRAPRWYLEAIGVLADQ